MKAKLKLFYAMVISLAFVLGETAMAAPKALIDMSSGSPAPSLAKSWTKVKDGEYTFELDTTQEVKAGTKVSPALVKDALEGKLGSSMGLKVTEKGPSTVDVTYTGDEAKFLEQVGKTKIRAKGGDAELAMDDSVSEGGIRAKAEDRNPVAGEVKATALNFEGSNVIIAKVNASKDGKFKDGDKIKVQGPLKGLKKKELFYFMPEKQDKGVWTAKKGTLK